MLLFHYVDGTSVHLSLGMSRGTADLLGYRVWVLVGLGPGLWSLGIGMGTPVGTMDHTRTLTHQYTQTCTAGVGLHVGTRVTTCT